VLVEDGADCVFVCVVVTEEETEEGEEVRVEERIVDGEEEVDCARMGVVRRRMLRVKVRILGSSIAKESSDAKR
jgi:hypothetical protein